MRTRPSEIVSLAQDWYTANQKDLKLPARIALYRILMGEVKIERADAPKPPIVPPRLNPVRVIKGKW